MTGHLPDGSPVCCGAQRRRQQRLVGRVIISAATLVLIYACTGRETRDGSSSGSARVERLQIAISANVDPMHEVLQRQHGINAVHGYRREGGIIEARL
ncbi:hypothetical protein WME75_08130 [Sorangium sp. So ce1014]|uniref:hypothetical protein n=1 Tax=Sorangium sp. So ce1014 TaxID=3133326 RepID=UPI003F612B93